METNLTTSQELEKANKLQITLANANKNASDLLAAKLEFVKGMKKDLEEGRKRMGEMEVSEGKRGGKGEGKGVNWN